MSKEIIAMNDYELRKAHRRDLYLKGSKMVICVACNGSGRYDNTNSPKCRACDGKGKVKET
jgi:DnaJ-class molecular chaperone